MELEQQHLEEQLRKDYELLKELEDALRLADSPKQKVQLRGEIQELKHKIQERKVQLNTLSTQQYESNQQNIDELMQQIRVHCCEKIQDLYSKIRLLNFRQVDVDQLYVEVHILEQPSRSIYATIPELLRERNLRNDFDRFGLGWRSAKRLPGLDAANRFSRLMILGRPGAGKSTFLRYLAMACCKGEFPQYRIPVTLLDFWFKWHQHIQRIQNRQHLEVGRLNLWLVSLAYFLICWRAIPVLIELRSIENSSQFNLLSVLQQEFQFIDEQQIQDILSTGRVLLLLDGLDEIADQSRQLVQTQILQFAQIYRKTRIILTCRTQTVEYILPNFEYVEVADFNPEQVAIFAQNWFTTLDNTPEQGSAMASQFMNMLRSPEYQRTADLAVTPILLSLACLVFQDREFLPAKRIELYQRGLDLLLEQWDTVRGVDRSVGSERYRLLNIQQKQELLSYIAICKFEQKQFALFEQQEIQHHIASYFKRSEQIISDRESRDILKAIEAQHGLLVERASQIYSFSHLTFQEFFAAKWLCDSTNQRNLLHYLTETRGQELLRFALEMPVFADDVVQSLKQSIDGLLALDEKLQQFLNWMHQKTSAVNVACKAVAVRAFYYALVPALERDLTRDIALELAFDRALDIDLARALAFDLVLARGDLARDLTLARNLALALDLGLAFVHPNFDFTRDLAHDLVCLLNLESQHNLQALTRELPDPERNWHYFQQWWQINGKDWIARLRSAIVEYRNIGHEWNFSKEQKALLKQYHDANKRLVDLLQSNCEITPAVRQEIEETMLLPSAEIEKRKKAKQRG